jgi:hypothetical protein
MNAVYSSRQMKRRYEVEFLRCSLADGSGAWWFRYLLMNLGRDGCKAEPSGLPVQVWATWFPREGRPQTFVQSYPADALTLSPRRQLPFHFCVAENGIELPGATSRRRRCDLLEATLSFQLWHRSQRQRLNRLFQITSFQGGILRRNPL